MEKRSFRLPFGIGWGATTPDLPDPFGINQIRFAAFKDFATILLLCMFSQSRPGLQFFRETSSAILCKKWRECCEVCVVLHTLHFQLGVRPHTSLTVAFLWKPIDIFLENLYNSSVCGSASSSFDSRLTHETLNCINSPFLHEVYCSVFYEVLSSLLT
ncbi:hypothetical protein Syun_028909 [Stephania yunnanensis]|uniref:Uncharacterized protein n=1 Tax=Stephania yunnanensis TaxID=152371 RepID=A0AAP0E4E7_9MAGN